MRTSLHLLPRLPYFQFGTHGVCTYCGDAANGLDHVIPVSYQRGHKKARLSANGPVTPACHNCNNNLNARFFDSFRLRAEFAHEAIKKYARPIVWHNWELAKLDYNLQQSIKWENSQRKWLGNRADWFGSRDYLLGIENLQWELRESGGSPTARQFLQDFFRDTLSDISIWLYHKGELESSCA
jgi:hypothetical protein